MLRRDVLGILTSAAAWPITARAQQGRVPVVGFMSVRSAEDAVEEVAAFRRGLAEGGLRDGQNVRIEFKWGEGRYERLQAQADELIALPVSVIAGFGPVPALAAKSRTQTIPIVFTSSADPVKAGLVDNLRRPGGNLTGISYLAVDLGMKRMELLHEWLPGMKRLGFLVNPAYTEADAEIAELKKAAETFGIEVRVAPVRDEAEIRHAFPTLAGEGIGAVMIPGDAFFNRLRRTVVVAVNEQRLAAVYPWRGYVTEGGLLSYGASLSDGFRQAGVYVARILSGTRPGDLPVQQPTKFELAINLKTARALGLMVPPTLLARADEVIE